MVVMTIQFDRWIDWTCLTILGLGESRIPLLFLRFKLDEKLSKLHREILYCKNMGGTEGKASKDHRNKFCGTVDLFRQVHIIRLPSKV